MAGKEEAAIERDPEEEIGGNVKTKSVSPSNPSLKPEVSEKSGVSTPSAFHRNRHIELHSALDELAADWLRHTGGSFSQHTILELMEWSYQQTITPAETSDATPAGPLEQKGSQD